MISGAAILFGMIMGFTASLCSDDDLMVTRNVYAHVIIITVAGGAIMQGIVTAFWLLAYIFNVGWR